MPDIQAKKRPPTKSTPFYAQQILKPLQILGSKIRMADQFRANESIRYPCHRPNVIRTTNELLDFASGMAHDFRMSRQSLKQPSLPDAQVLKELQKLPNIGPACARDLMLLGINGQADLKGKDPDELYDRLCALTGTRQDPCVWDTLASVVDYANGNPPKKWWEFTGQRKRHWANTGRK